MKKHMLLLTAAIVLLLSLCACSDIGVPDVPVLSHETGRYEQEFTLTVSAGKGTTVRYTTDGSLPTAESPEFPQEGLQVKALGEQPSMLASVPVKDITWDEHIQPSVAEKGTVIRAVAFNRKGECSETVTATYLVGMDYDKIKVVSLVMDSADLFDYEKGIYILGKAHDDWLKENFANQYANTWEIEGNFTQKGRDWERDVHLQVIEKDGSLGMAQDMGIRIMGAASRTYFQKSFRLTAREEYGSKHFEYPLIDGLVTDSTGEPLEKYKSFVLRNGGNDNSYCLMRDVFIQKRLDGRAFATQDAEPAVVFINGEYWGLYTITEDYSDNYIQYNYGVDNENVVLIKRGELEEGKESDFALYQQLFADIESTDLSTAEGLEWLESQMDVQGLIDTFAANIYINNMDGIFADNNWRIWRARDIDPSNEYADGRWRFMLYDTEYSLGLYEDGKNFKADSLKDALENEYVWGRFFARLMENEQFRARFINTFMDLRNTAFEPYGAWETLSTTGGKYLPYAADNYARNAQAWVIMWSDVDSRLLNEMGSVKLFLDRRYRYVDDMLRDNLGLGELCTLSLRAEEREGGIITVNTADYDLSGGSCYPEYFIGSEIAVTVQPAEGYTFAGWAGDAAGQEQSFTCLLEGNMTIEAIFEKQ